MREKIAILISISVIVAITSCGSDKAKTATESTTEESLEDSVETKEIVMEEPTEEISEETVVESETSTEEETNKSEVSVNIPSQDFNDMTYVMEGCDFRRSKWGDTIDDVSVSEPVWDEYEEDTTQETFEGEKVYMRAFASRFGSYGRTVCYYHFDGDGKLYKGEFVTGFDGTTGVNEAAEEIYGMIQEQPGRHAIDNKYINSDSKSFDDDLPTGNGMRLSGWELDDGTLLIESVLPMEDINVIIIGYYDPESEHSSEGIAGFGYNLWQQLSS